MYTISVVKYIKQKNKKNTALYDLPEVVFSACLKC